jgi:hypothetical protein
MKKPMRAAGQTIEMSPHSSFFLLRCRKPGNFCNGSGNLLPVALRKMGFVPAKAAILQAGTVTASQDFA